MFRKLRRENKQISREEIVTLLEKTRIGFLSVSGEEGYPYCVPINYYFDAETGSIYFHGSSKGHKADSLKLNDKVCFTVIGNEETADIPWAPYVKSVIIFGHCHMVSERTETVSLLKKFALKYYPDEETVDREIDKSGNHAAMYNITIEHISGKWIQEK